MPIFISYSHKDKDFVDRLAMQLVRTNVHVWLDRWELSVGDSIVDKVQEAVDGASALLVILSKASVESEWCKKELSAGLLRELEEKRVVVMPVMLEECTVPVFARGKMFADFRTDFDAGFRLITEGIAKVTSASLGRTKEATYHTDWSIDWGNVNGRVTIILNYVQVPNKEPHTCLTNIAILATPAATRAFESTKEAEGVEVAKLHVVKLLLDKVNKAGGLLPRLADEREKIYKFEMKGAGRDEAYEVRIGVRRIGEDNGRDILVNTGNVIAETYQHMTEVLGKPKNQRP
ncbi:toll/interleukin-1 receptor domain-containing protein [Corticimicrobacter populi]|uniref:Toll/interleukin-1 receptor domain-containing protein n=1 Tax=Corticimicrobacter populi TaxID=2175229 RepID=A0A2V1K318_9BURK|nr:toll/interleukin-1 receptor domain-containing protein [Corticimicrobacter populi]PWF23957.1 toll/interleukin-1 receptor domain-containing protein [Corticimicrobacter populi]